jgi:hypothetical protein
MAESDLEADLEEWKMTNQEYLGGDQVIRGDFTHLVASQVYLLQCHNDPKQHCKQIQTMRMK